MESWTPSDVRMMLRLRTARRRPMERSFADKQSWTLSWQLCHELPGHHVALRWGSEHAGSLPSDAPVEPNWHIACNGQQMQSGQVPSQPLAPAPLPCRLPTTPTPDPFQREVHEGFLQPPPHGRAVQSGVARARTPRTPMPQSAPEDGSPCLAHDDEP
eukprot:3560211-Amphidinium_carterae.1